MLVPPLAMMAGIGYTVWPYLESSPTPPAVEKKPEILLPKNLLSLKLPEQSERDPFVRGTGLSSIASPSDGLATTPGSLTTSKSSTIAQEKAKLDLEAEGLTLGAVLVGNHRAAIINGKIYSLGATIAPKAANGPYWQLARIETYGVILLDRKRRKPIALGFAPAATRLDSQAASSPAASNPALTTLIGQLAGIDLSSLEGVLGQATAPSTKPSEPSKKGQH